MAAFSVEIGQVRRSGAAVRNIDVPAAPGPARGTIATIERGELDGSLRADGRMVSDDDLGAAVAVQIADRDRGPGVAVSVPERVSPERLAVAEREGA